MINTRKIMTPPPYSADDHEESERHASRRDGLIAVAAFAVIVVVLISIDSFELIFHLTRDHENWEVDEFFAAIPAAAAAMAWFAYRRWRQSRRLAQELKAAFARRHRMEAELRESQRVAALGQLAGGLAHEINNTLQPVFALAGLCLDQKDLSDQTRQRIEKIVAAAERGRDISRKALTYAAVREDTADPIALSEAVSEIVAFLDETTTSSVRIEAAIERSSAVVRVQPTELMQVMTNIIGNADDAMESAGVIGVACEYIDRLPGGSGAENSDPREFARITVSDAGSGMSEEIKKRIFDPFFSTKRPGSGTGLGLSVVQGIVEKWGGELRVESTEGLGTAIEIYVPVDSNNASERSNRNEQNVVG